MKIGFFPGLQFNCPQVLSVANERKIEAKVFTGSPKLITSESAKCSGAAMIFCPLPFRSLTRITGRSIPQKFKYADAKFYSLLASLLSSRNSSDANHCWATFALEVFKNQRQSKKILDRPCPHVLEQQNTLRAYMAERDLPFEPHSNWFIDRQLEEYERADCILVPSKMSYNSFKKNGLGHKTFVAPLGPNAVQSSIKRYAEKKVRTNQRDKKIIFGAYASNWKRQGLFDLLLALGELRLNWRLILRATKHELESFPWSRFPPTTKDRVVLKPYFNSIFEYFNEIDVLASPAVESGFGMIVVEALLNGKPVVCSNQIGALDLVRDLPGCVVTTSQKPEDLSKALEYAAALPGAALTNINKIEHGLVSSRIHYEKTLLKAWGL